AISLLLIPKIRHKTLSSTTSIDLFYLMPQAFSFLIVVKFPRRPVSVTVINFTEHQLVAYQCALDLTTGKPLNESVDEYFYNDIVSVATTSDTFTYSLTELDRRLLSRAPGIKKSAVNGKIQVNAGETFILSTSGGNSVRVILNDPVLVQGLGGGELPLEWAEQAVQAVRKMLREKKAGALPLRRAGI
ncbi:MAG: hypothetical protein WAM82_20505, partial [Thermoanaerobaculia bacterium]